MIATDITRDSKPGESRSHLPGLDGIRGIAILLVMLSHFIMADKTSVSDSAIARLLHSGYLGVDLFFVLSGFLITGILIDSKNSPNYFSVFYMRRALRIFPLYYGLLAIAWLTAQFITPRYPVNLSEVDSMAWYWLYASNIGMAVKGGWLTSPSWIGLGHFWSLAVEEQFYLFWPLVVYRTNTASLKRLCILLVAISPLVHIFLPHLFGGGDAGNLANYVSTINRLGVLAAGGWLSIIWREQQTWPSVKKLLIPCAVVSGTFLLLERSVLRNLQVIEPSMMLVLSTALVGLAACGKNGPLQSGFFASPMLRWLGKYSYGIYVYHHALKPLWIHFLWDGWISRLCGTEFLGTLAYTASATTATLILAWLSWTFFEEPILSLKSRFRYGSHYKQQQSP